MKTVLERRGGIVWRMPVLAWCLAVAIVALGGTAHAQQVAPAVPSPLQLEPERNGINVVDGQIDIPGPELGVPAAPRLHFRRLSDAMPLVNGKIAQTPPGQYPQATYSFHTAGATSEVFQCMDNWDCTGRTGTGSIMRPLGNGIVLHQGGTGAIYSYTNVVSDTSTAYAAFATSASYPDGDSLIYTYGSGVLQGSPSQTVYRASRITSSAGYYIQITFASNDINADLTGWLTMTEAALYRSSDPTTPLQRLTYNSAAGTVTDLAGRVFQCVDCSSGLVGSGELVRGARILPGETTPAIQATWISSSSQVVGSVARDGVPWTYAYGNIRFSGSNGQYLFDSLTVTGPNGYHTVYALDQQGPATDQHNVVTSITDALNRVTSYEHDSLFRPTQVTYPEGNWVHVYYDDFGNITSRVTHAKPGSGLPDLTETAHYTTSACTALQTDVSCYRPDYTIDARGHQTDYLYNSAGQVTERTEPADADGVRRKTYVTYTTSGPSRPSVVRVCGATTTCGTTNEIRTEYDYWGSTALPSAVRRIDAAHGVTLETTYAYDPAGRMLSEDGPLTGTDDASYYCYDILGRRTGTIGPKGANALRQATRTTYRASDDKVTKVETGTVAGTATACSALATMTVLNQVDTAYDAHRNPVREAASSGGTTYTLTQRTFDDRGQLSCEAQRMNPATFASEPASACTLGTQGSFGGDRITHNVYNNAGELTQVQRAYGIAGLQQNYATYSYWPNGQRASVTDANGNRAEMTYDGYDRQRRWIFPSATTHGIVNAADYEEYSYDANGNRTSLRKRDGTMLTYQYDNLNRMIVKVVPSRSGLTAAQTRDVYYGYDMANLQTFARFDSASGEGVTNSYDTLGRLLSSATNMGGTTRTLAYQYDAAGDRTRVTHPDGQYFTYAYDDAGRLTGLMENGASSVISASYNPAGLPATLTRSGAMTTFGYDTVNRLNALTHDLAGTLSDVTSTFAYNPASQVVSRTRSNDLYAWDDAAPIDWGFTPNGLNQYTNIDGVAHAYDANGNLTSDGLNTYLYDIENRLVQVSGGHSATLVYDPLGRLFQVGTTRFLYDGDALVAEYNMSGTLLRRYVHGSDAAADDPLLWYEGATVSSTTRHQLFADHQGSIVAITNGSGTLTDHDSYDEWGLPGTTNQDAERFQYTGQVWLPEVGLYYYKARVYSPVLGRFMQTDPVGYEDQINLYAYVGNDPVNGIDFSGECETSSDANGGTRYSGVCGTSTEAAQFVDSRMHDQNSRTSEVDARAVEQGRLIQVRFDSQDVDNHDVNGATTQEDGSGTVSVTIDRGDQALVSGHDAITGDEVLDHRMTDEESFEHEVVGHANDIMTGQRGENNAISAENAYRERRGDSFRREGHGGRIVPRAGPIPRERRQRR